MSYKPGRPITIEVQGLTYVTPIMPSWDKIRGYDLSRNQQIWQRREEYLQWGWGDGWEVDATQAQLQWLSEEIDRLQDGDWIMIDNVPTYFNRYAYFFHQWFTLEDGYPDYRDTSLEFMYFYELCFKHHLCLGMVLIKGRRLGATSMCDSIQLLNAISEKNTLQGMTSKTREDAKEAFKITVNAFAKLPVFLKPKNSGNDAAANELYIREQPKRIKINEKVSQTGEGLNNRVNYLAPSENTYDGRRLFTVLVDEAGKMPVEMSVDKYWQILKKCLMKGARIVGKCLMVTTVNVAAKGGSEFRKVWDGADLDQRDRLGATKNGLWRFFIPGWKGYDGYVDQFGNSVWDTPTPEQTAYLASIGCPDPTIGSKEYTDQLKAKESNDLEKYMEELRLCPSEWQDVFKAANNISYFNRLETQNRLEEIKGELLVAGMNPEKDELGRRGFFAMTAPNKSEFIEDETGMWRVYELLPESEANKFEYSYGRKIPTNTAAGAAGLDPIATTRLTVDKGSDAAISIRKRYSSINPETSGGLYAVFIGRPKKKTDFHKQLFAALHYYGVKVLGELAPDDWVVYAEDNNLTGYLVATINSSGKEVYGISPQNKQAREEHLTEQVESNYHDIPKIQCRRLLEDRLAFDPDFRTVYDMCMADGYALMALKEAYYIPPTERKKIRVLATGSISVG